MVWSAQNWLISSEICLEKNHKIGCFLRIAFWWSLPRKLPRNYREIGRFFCEFVPKNPVKFELLFRELSEAQIRTVINHTDPKMFSGLLNTDFLCTLLWTWDPQLVGNKTRLETTCNVLAVLWSIFSNHLWLSLKAWLLLTKPIYPFHWLKDIFLMYSPGLKLTITFLSLTGLLIFCAVAEPRNSGISAKSREIHKNKKNTAKFGRNLIKYMSVQHIWNLFQL